MSDFAWIRAGAQEEDAELALMARRNKGMLSLTGSGDDGTTGLLGGGRVAKDDARIEAYGTVDEASSALGLAKALATDERVREICEELQRGLYRLGAELSTAPGKEGQWGAMTDADVAGLEALTARLEAEVSMPAGFVLPGATAASGALDLARTVVRRAERCLVRLGGSGAASNRQTGRYLNRLSLLLFVLARFEEGRAGVAARAARD